MGASKETLKGPFPTSFLRRMAPEARKPLGKVGLLPEEVDDKAAKCKEKELQDQCESWLRRNDIFYLRMPMHKPTSIRCGWPDFTVFLPGGHALLMEMKVNEGRISEDQKQLHLNYNQQTGQFVLLIVNYDQFVSWMERWLARVADTTDAPPQTASTSQSH